MHSPEGSDRLTGMALGIFGEQHICHLLFPYQLYYNELRVLLALKKDAPFPRDARVGRVLALPILGGLHHRYVRV